MGDFNFFLRMNSLRHICLLILLSLIVSVPLQETCHSCPNKSQTEKAPKKPISPNTPRKPFPKPSPHVTEPFNATLSRQWLKKIDSNPEGVRYSDHYALK